MKFIDLRTNAIVIADAELAKEYLTDKNFRIAMDADFKESDHPRDKDGKFSSGGGGSASSTKETKSKDRAQQNLDKAKYWREQAQAEKATNPKRAARYEREAENFEKEGKRMMEETSKSSSKVGTTSNYDKMTSAMKQIETKYKNAKASDIKNSGELADKAYALSSKGMSPESFAAHLEASIAYDIEGKRALSERHREISNNIFTKLGYKKKEQPAKSTGLSAKGQEEKRELEGKLGRYKAQLSALERHPNVSAQVFASHGKILQKEIAEIEDKISKLK